MSDLTIDIEHREEAIIAHITGDASVATANEFQKGIMGLAADEPKRVVLDMAHLAFMSSLSMGSLISLQKRVEWGGGKVVACGMNENLAKAFQRARLDKVIATFNTVDEALAG